MTVLDYFLLKYRWIFICFYLLPVSLLYETCVCIKRWIFFKLYSSPSQHRNKVRKIQKEVQQWIKSGQKLHLCTLRSSTSLGSDRHNYKDSQYTIPLNLFDILKIDGERRLVKVEPCVTMGQLTSTLLPLGWTIPVIPGIDDLTVGGLILGTGLDSSSHKYGLFHKSCVSYELVLCDGSHIKCSQDENCDLFYAVPWSYGTLGLLTAIQIRLIPAHNYVKLHFKAFHNENVAVEKFLTDCCNKNNDFVEGLMYSQNQLISVTGKMVDQIEANKVNEIGKWYKPWFFQHVKSYFIKGCGSEYIPLKDYYYRHTRSVYWELQDIIPFGNNIIFRLLFGWAVPIKLSFFKVTQAELYKKLYGDEPIMLDFIIPADELQPAIDMFDRKLGIYPIWLCPVELNNCPGFVHSVENEELYINVGIYGIPKAHDFHPCTTIKEAEDFVREIGGFQMLYTDIHMSEDEFREQFDHMLYDKMRMKLNCHRAFPTVFEKIKFIKRHGICSKNIKDLL